MRRVPLRRSVRLPRRHPAVAWSLALGGPALIAAGSRLAGTSVPPASLLFLTLLVVVAVALTGGVRPAVTAVVTGLLAQELLFNFPYGSLADHKPAQLTVLVGFVVIGCVVGFLVDELARLTAEQMALRRVATLVVDGARPEELFTVISEVVGRLMAVDRVGLGRFESDGTITQLAFWDRLSLGAPPVGRRWVLGGTNVASLIAQTGRAARIEDPSALSGALGETGRELGARSVVATPIMVEGHLWGTLGVMSVRDRRLPASTEARLAAFTELLASAIANVESRVELTASRARVVTAADETRRRIERDLHDGAQQRLLSLGLELGVAQAAVPPGLASLKAELSRVAAGLVGVQEELRHMARGIHPAILADAGLPAALKALARRSGIPVALEVSGEGRLPAPVEVAAYYVVSEALANAAKHADASVIRVDVATSQRVLRVCVRDDGVGGASESRGSGLMGLKDRVEALGGAMTVLSPPGVGTSIQAAFPLDDG
jgi:signal transduction histidine kinase